MSMKRNADCFKQEGNKIYLNYPKMEIYVPEQYFDSKLAIQDGELIDLFFLLKYRLFNDVDSKASSLPLFNFKSPVMYLTKPDEIYNQTMDIFNKEEKFTVLVYYKGAEVIVNTEIVKSVDILEKTHLLMFDGKIRVDYASANTISNLSQYLNGNTIGVPQYIQQLAISEVYRDATDYSRPARLIASSTKNNDNKIRPLNQRENAAFTSTLAGVSFEDPKSMITVADNRADRGVKTPMSAIERAIRGIKPDKDDT